MSINSISSFKPWQSGCSALMALAIATGTTAPMFISAPVSAQLFPSSPGRLNQTTIRTGASIPVQYKEAKKNRCQS